MLLCFLCVSQESPFSKNKQHHRAMVWETEPRGAAVKRHGSRVQGEGIQAGQEKQHFDFH